MLRVETLEPRCLLSRYTLTDFGPGTVGEVLNNQGVAGGAYGRDYPFLIASDGQRWEVNTPEQTVLTHLTDTDLLTGQINDLETDHAAYWDNHGTQFHDLGTLGGQGATTTGANATGTLVGYSSLTMQGSPIHAWVDRGAGLEDLGTLPGEAASFACAINQAGVIVGSSGPYAVRWGVHGHLKTLDIPEEATDHAAAVAINDAGLVVGNTTHSGGGSSAWVYQHGQTRTLPDLGTGYALVHGLNARGDVTGLALAPGGAYHAVLWHGGRVTDLNGPWAPAGWVLRDAAAVNDKGQVVGTALTPDGLHGYLLTPTRDLGWLGWALTLEHKSGGGIRTH